MESLTRSQRLALVAAGAVAALVFIVLTAYFATAAAHAPRVKHMILFVALAIVSALIAWFAYPTGPEAARRL